MTCDWKLAFETAHDFSDIVPTSNEELLIQSHDKESQSLHTAGFFQLIVADIIPTEITHVCNIVGCDNEFPAGTPQGFTYRFGGGGSKRAQTIVAPHILSLIHI